MPGDRSNYNTINARVIIREPAREGHVSFRHHLGDFANVFKAFLGANYLTVSFAFKQSGLVLGVFGLLIIAGLTDLCCHIIIKCKYAAISKIMRKAEDDASRDGSALTEVESNALYQRIVKSLQYGDIGRVALGPPGRVLVNIFIMLTQFGFCVAYFIFIGNTLVTIFACQKFNHFDIGNNSYPVNHSLSNATISHVVHHSTGNRPLYDLVIADDVSSHVSNSSNMTTTATPPHTKPTPNPNYSPWTNIIKASSTCLPPLAVFVLVPLPIFIAFSLIRHVRHLGIISILADVSIFGGCGCMLVYLASTFSLTSIAYFRWATFPIFIGAVTSSYEGIGTIIPIESSMEGNRKNFPMFLHFAVLGLSLMLAVLGILGYLHFGDGVEQMLNLNIVMSSHLMTVVSKFVDSTLCLGILLTFPLQLFPVIELLETYLLAEGRIFGPSHSSAVETSYEEEDSSLITNSESDRDLGITIAVQIPQSVPAWKRNILRVLVVLCAAGVGVLCRNIYAYLSAFIGAVGSTMLAFVLPCIFQTVLCWSELSTAYVVRNVAISLFGIIAGIVSVYSIISQLIENPL